MLRLALGLTNEWDSIYLIFKILDLDPLPVYFISQMWPEQSLHFSTSSVIYSSR